MWRDFKCKQPRSDNRPDHWLPEIREVFNMIKNSVAWLALAFAIGAAPLATAYSGGGPARRSGGDFPGELSCTACHTGSEVNSGGGTLELLIGDAAADGQSYTPGEALVLIVEFEDSNASRIGFELTARSGDGCGSAGSLATTSSDNGASVKVVDGTCGDGTSAIQWATHSSPRSGSSTTFEVQLTPPSESVGPIKVAVAVNGANGNLATSGDKIYTAQATLSVEGASTGPPTISDGGVVLIGGASASSPQGAPGAIVALSGTNFAETGVTMQGTVDDDGDLSTVVNGVCVEVGGERAPILHVAHDQILVQVPVDTGLGSVSVQVIRNCDSPTDGPEAVRSNSSSLTISSVQPVIIDFSETVSNVFALHADLAVVAAADAFTSSGDGSGTSTETESTSAIQARPAAPGDVVTVYGTGFGLTDPGLRSGEMPGLPRALAAASIKGMVGEFEVAAEDIVYAGASPEIAGLYQVSARIPTAVPDGDHSFSLILDGQTTTLASGLVVAAASTEPEVQACTLNLVLQPGESCEGSISGIAGVFEVPEEGDNAGQGCISAPSISFSQCYESAFSLLGAVEAERADDGSWKITKFPAPPDP